ncbi:MAG: TolC family protein [bacterium]|nr:TolC family protein [bacterium]
MKRTILALIACFSLVAGGEEPADGAKAGADRPWDLSQTAPELLKAVEAIEAHLESHPAPDEAPVGDVQLYDVRQCVQMALTRNAQVLVAEDEVVVARTKIGQARAEMLPHARGSITFTHMELNTPETNKYMDLVSSFSSGSMGGSSGLGGGSGGLLGGSGGGLGGGGNLLGGILSSGDPLGTLATTVNDLSKSLVTSYALNRFIEEYVYSQEDMMPDDDLRIDQFSVTQVLYAGGQIRAAIRAAKHLRDSQEWQRSATLAELEYATKQSYYDALLTKSLVDVAKDSVRSFKRNLADAEQMFDVGMISNFEVLRARTELGNRQATLVEARNAQKLALTNLRRILALPQSTPIDVAPKLEWKPDSTTAAAHVAHAMSHRPEILALEKAILASEQGVKRAIGQYKPQLGGSIQYENTYKGGPTIADGWTFGIGGEWEIFSGNRRKYDVEQARAQLASLEHQLQDLQQIVELDVNQAYIQIQDAMAKIKSDRGTVDLAQEGLRLAELRFKEGVGTQSETLDAELALTSAQTSLVQSLRDYAVANASLERATGRNWHQGDPPAAE